MRGRHLLREGLRVAEVASLLGFSNPRDFSIEFKRIVGVTPTWYQEGERERAFPQ